MGGNVPAANTRGQSNRGALASPPRLRAGGSRHKCCWCIYKTKNPVSGRYSQTQTHAKMFGSAKKKKNSKLHTQPQEPLPVPLPSSLTPYKRHSFTETCHPLEARTHAW